MQHLRDDFPLLRGDHAPAYLDNACVTLKPQSVIDAVTAYYTERPACGGRSVHRLGTAVSQTIARARRGLAAHLGARDVAEVAFVRNATHALNQVAHGLSWEAGDVVLTSDKEHNSNLVPWLELERLHGVDHRVVPSNDDNTVNMEAFEAACDEAGSNLRLISIGQVSNLDGVEAPVKELASLAHDHNALMCVDGAQSAPHMHVDVADLDADFFACSLHKMMGPSGMGALWGRMELLENLHPLITGGHTVDTSTYEGVRWAAPPSRFEAGLGHYAGIAGTEAAIEYLSALDLNAVHEHEVRMNRIMTDGVKDLHGVHIIGPQDAAKRGGICSLLLDEHLPSHDLAVLLDEAASVMVRSGRHCVHSWFEDRAVQGDSLRASAYFYTSEDDVKRFVDVFSEAVHAMSA
ncbi:MAG: aminotransferase class V-fold PLP-dependent enzyme [archaeon]|nr:aminotransferase class V-fold PLP-dependent enzyme [archaeon]